MKRLGLLTACAGLALSALTAWAGPWSPQIGFTTTDCNGATGYAAVDMHRISRIHTSDCPAPGKQGEALMQVLVYSGHNAPVYQAYTVTREEAREIQRQIRRRSSAAYVR